MVLILPLGHSKQHISIRCLTVIRLNFNWLQSQSLSMTKKNPNKSEFCVRLCVYQRQTHKSYSFIDSWHCWTPFLGMRIFCTELVFEWMKTIIPLCIISVLASSIFRFIFWAAVLFFRLNQWTCTVHPVLAEIFNWIWLPRSIFPHSWNRSTKQFHCDTATMCRSSLGSIAICNVCWVGDRQIDRSTQ